ncbi:iron-containing redox enzyme family protein [Tellurirhabdus rosea]|uniref:iron-containing redox enzyme family protein n=1 Tax=Tellurirhabdus rosea TaxID=2674997 RepID=UPI00225710CC|nr:iron-containing redox enzyme family protein [Tellurirhabdus rosea]
MAVLKKSAATPAALAFVQKLDRKMEAVLAEVEQSELYQMIADPDTDARLVALIVKYILLEVFSYGPHVTEATFMAISRLPKNRPDLMKPLILHDLSEVDHGEMALRDFVRLGGEEAWARARRMTPESLAMAATCRMLAQFENPFAYLGYMYLFEGLTPILTERAQVFLKAKGFPAEARGFIDEHATEDIGHAQLMANMVARIVTEFPEAEAAIEYGFDCFAAVYPLPIWRRALQHAYQEFYAE